MEEAVIYARYSSNAQRDVSIDQQLQVCRAFAERQGIKVVGIYEDRAMTGTSDKRPGFQRMIADAEKSNWSYVIVYALDRFARDRYDSAIYKRKLRDTGVRVLSAMENLTEDPTGILLESLLEGMAEYYSRELAQKVSRGMEDNARRCLVNGPLPPGYRKGSDGKYAIYEPEAAVILELFQRVRGREPLSDILSDFEARGLRTRKGIPWSRGIVDRILVNERYTGVYIYGDIRIEGGIPAIVDRELFDAVQVVMGCKKNPRKIKGAPQRRRREHGIYLLTGKLYCGECKTPMVGVSGHGKAGNPYYYYVCQKHRADHTCSAKPVRRDQIEHAVTLALQKNILNDETICALADGFISYQSKSQESAELQGLETNLADVRRSLKNIMQAIENGLYSPTVQKRLMELETSEKELDARISLLKKQSVSLPSREDIILTMMMFRDGDAADKEYQQAIIDAFLVRAYLYGDKLKFIFKLGSGQTTEVEIPVDFDIDSVLPDEPESSYKPIIGSPELLNTIDEWLQASNLKVLSNFFILDFSENFIDE